MSGWWVISVVKKRNDIADVAWGLGFVLIAWWQLFFNLNQKTILVAILVTIWGARLAIHIYKRNKNKKEDWRYEKLKGLVKVFLFQGVLMFLVSVPIQIISRQNGETDGWMIAGTLIWLLGFLIESKADKQLADFLKEKKGGVLKTGLWKYSRHPNYFGEVMLWWGVFVIGIGGKEGILGIIGPLTITFLILKVSGIPLLEKRFAGDKEYEKYKKVTSIFVPLPPKKS